MRNKPGQLAVIVRADNDPGHLHKVVMVVALRFAMGEPAWQINPPVFWTASDGRQFEVMWDDRDLEPIKPHEVQATQNQLAEATP